MSLGCINATKKEICVLQLTMVDVNKVHLELAEKDTGVFLYDPDEL